MNATSPDNGQQPSSRKSQRLAWFALFAVAFILTLVSLIVLGGNEGGIGQALLLAMASAGVALALTWFVRWLCHWRNLGRFFFGVACVVTLIALAYFEEDVRGRHAWLQHKQALEAKGEKFLVTDLAPRPVPDAENFALTPVLKPALDYSRVNGTMVWNDTNGLARLDKLHAELASSRSSKAHLVLGRLDQGTFADLEACRQFYQGNTNYPQRSTSGTPAEDVLFALSGSDTAFRELREARVHRPLTRFPIEYDSEPPSGILLPHLARLKGLTILAEVRATAELEAGRLDDAYADLLVGFRLSDAIRDEPFLIDHLVRIALLNIDLQTLREGLVRHQWTDAQLSQLQSYLAGVDLLAEYRFVMRGERALATGGLDFLRRQGFRSDVLSYMDAEGTASMQSGFNPFPSGWFYQNMLTISRMHEDFTLAAADEKAHRVYPETAAQLDALLEKMPRRPYTLFAKMLMPAVNKAVRKSARMQVAVDSARIACALERYRLANGALPATLTALAPRFVDQIPNDVMDGKPLRYHAQSDGGYSLYSVGWNLTDDGGEIAWQHGKDPGVDVSAGDWVWQMPGKQDRPTAPQGSFE